MTAKEERQCDVCGEKWVDNGDPVCPFCASDKTRPVDDSQSAIGKKP